jgi:Secretion system C-terminal sorting domain
VPENIVVAESESITLTIGVVDKEGNTFTVNSAQAYPGVSHAFGDGVLTLTVTPNFGDAGIYNYKFTAKDEYNASTEIVIPAEILHTNRAPEFIGESRSMTFNATKELNEFAITDFFNDPDNDVFTFTLTSNNPEAIIVFASENQFLIKPMAVGESKLAFAVKDSHGSTTYDTLSVSVDVVLAVEEPLNYGLSVYPNPAKDFVTITIPNDWTGDVTFALTDATGKQHLSKQIAIASERKTIVDISGLSKGIYILKAASNAKQSTVKVIKK